MWDRLSRPSDIWMEWVSHRLPSPKWIEAARICRSRSWMSQTRHSLECPSWIALTSVHLRINWITTTRVDNRIRWITSAGFNSWIQSMTQQLKKEKNRSRRRIYRSSQEFWGWVNKMLPPHFKRAWKKQQQKKDGRRRDQKQSQRIAKSCVKFTITSFLGFDSEGEDVPTTMRNKSKKHVETDEPEWLDLSDTEEEFDENIVAQPLNTTSALGDQTSIWDEKDEEESEMEDPKRNLFTSSPKQPSSEESKRSSKDSAVGSITPTELKFSSPESDSNTKTVITKEQSQLQIVDDNSAIQSPFRRRRFKAIYLRKRMNASNRKRRNANPASPTHLVIESVDDQLYTSLLFNVSALETEEAHQDQAAMNLNSTPTSDKKPSKKFKLFGITIKNPFKKNSSKKGQQPKQRKEVIPGMTEEDIVQLIRDFERRKALGLVSTKCTYLWHTHCLFGLPRIILWKFFF